MSKLRFIEKFLAGFIGLVSFMKGYTFILIAILLIEYFTNNDKKVKDN